MEKRLHEIDGVRGWASLVVLIYHLSWLVFGVIFPVYRSFYFKFFLDGPLAVYVFFVLSGDALSCSFIMKGNQRSLAKLVLKRYFRLSGPILLSCIFVYILLKQGIAFNSIAAKVVDSPDWLGGFLPFDASFASMLRYALLRVFTEHTVQNSYNPFLWPMSIELFGSFFIFGVLFSIRILYKPIYVVVLTALYLGILGSFFSLFFVGLGFSLLRAENFFEKIKMSRISRYSILGLVLIVVFDAFSEKVNFKPSQLSILMASSIVFLVYSSKEMVSFCSNRFSRFLGRVSFPLYICQFSVIVSYTSWVIVYFQKQGMLDFKCSLFVIFSSILLTFLIAELFARI